MAPTLAGKSPLADTAETAAFSLVRELAAALSAGTVSLPSYPQVAIRLQKMLADDDSDADMLVRVLGAEPVLAARVTTMAGSAALNPTGRKITDLRTAIVLLGFDALRTTAAAFAMVQIRQAGEYKNIEKPMAELWRESVARAAMAYVVARATGKSRPDTAMLAGVLSGIGKLYLLTQMNKHPDLFADEAGFHGLVRDWHASIAQALLESWQMAPEIVAAVRDWPNVDSDPRHSPDLADVLAAADLLISHGENPEILQGLLEDSRPMQRLGLKAGCASLLADSAAELESLRKALNG
ncbi:MAG: HDOD domain-containing protein [Proteobacteria bacterium]|nr:HDOD domain-containing protein [Pseudomonadota bacterium]